MSYSIDFGEISLEDYKKSIQNKSFIPSRQILKDEADINFSAFEKADIKNLEELFSIIKNKKKKVELLKDKNVSEEYLTVLLRELNSIKSKPLKLSEFGWISGDTLDKMAGAGIKNTQILYEKLGKAGAREMFLKTVDVDEGELLEILKLSDLTRIQWVNSNFARALLKSGFDTVKKVADADYEDLYNKVTEKNKELELYKGKIGLNDMKLCVEAANMIDAEIEV
jgi:hypothetical protein